jgi:presenilin-like A22 family membrane protease
MKHSLKITIILLCIFLLAQLIGLGILQNYIDPTKSAETGKMEFKDLPIGERPPLEEKTSYIPMIIAILIGTGLLLILIKFKLTAIWKGWFLLAVVLALVIAFSAFTTALIAFILALLLGIWKVFKPNFWVHNFTELFIYGGLAAIFVPLLSIFSASVLLILIAIYDAYAVWKSKHMITLATSQAKAKVFAGLLIPYKLGRVKKRKKSTKVKMIQVKMAMLGGGDIGFPLIFAGVILKDIGVWQAYLIPFFATLGLGYLLYISKEKKFYPAMPFIAAGCFLGMGLIYLL